MLYAKSNPVETLREHTDELLKQMNMLRECYGTNINSLNFLEVERFWQLLDFVIEFHDIGKAFLHKIFPFKHSEFFHKRIEFIIRNLFVFFDFFNNRSALFHN